MTLVVHSPRPLASDSTFAFAAYLLYLAGFFTVVSPIIGVVFAYLNADGEDPVLRSHAQFQIRTFWIGLLYLVAGALLCVVAIGVPLMAWAFVWMLVRNVKGGAALCDGDAIANPRSWLFG